jgi:hypothetical protein
MARAALFLRDLLGEDCTIFDHSGYAPSLPVANVSTPLPAQVYGQLEGQFFNGNAGMFEVGTKTGRGVYVNEGSGALTVLVPDGAYTANGLAVAIEDALNDPSNPPTQTYQVDYHPVLRKFSVQTSGTCILVNTNPNNVLTSECGWAASNTASVNYHLADSERSSTITRVTFDAGAGLTVAPDLIWLLLNSTGGTDTAAATLYDDATVYGHATYLGPTWAAWDSGASEDVAVSDRPAEGENTLQGAVLSGTGYRYWSVFWHHNDDHSSHEIGILRGAAAVTSATRTVREVSDQRLMNRTQARTLENQHPVELLSEWQITVELERWEASEFRAFKVAADRYGSANGVVFALRWTDIVAASLTLNGEADKGLALYGTIIDSSSDSYAGKDSDYLTGSLAFGQLRGPGAS